MIPEFIDPLTVKVVGASNPQATGGTINQTLYVSGFQDNELNFFEQQFLIYLTFAASYTDTTTSLNYLPRVRLSIFKDFSGNLLKNPSQQFNQSSGSFSYGSIQIQNTVQVNSQSSVGIYPLNTFGAGISIRYDAQIGTPSGSYFTTLTYGQLKKEYAIPRSTKRKRGIFW